MSDGEDNMMDDEDYEFDVSDLEMTVELPLEYFIFYLKYNIKKYIINIFIFMIKIII